MFSNLRDRLGTKATAIGVTMVLLGGGVALALPDEAVSGQETATANQEAAEEKALAAQETATANQEAAEEKAANAGENADTAQGEGVPEVVKTFLAELKTWVACIRDGATAHADQQSNADTRIEDDEYDEADKLVLCDEKPLNPNDVDGEGGPEDDGDRGRPDHAGKPDEAGLPDDAGPGR